MDTRLLAAALRIKAGDVRQADVERDADDNTLRDAVTLLRVLANVVDGMPLSKAFGAPGDWGYETKIGKALAAAGVAPQFQRLPSGKRSKQSHVAPCSTRLI